MAYHTLAVGMAALRGVPGEELMERDSALYYITNALAATSQGMMLAIPAPEWRICGTMRSAEMVATLLMLAETVQRKTFRQSPRGPKQPRRPHEGNLKRSHVSTAKLLMSRKVHPVAP